MREGTRSGRRRSDSYGEFATNLLVAGVSASLFFGKIPLLLTERINRLSLAPTSETMLLWLGAWLGMSSALVLALRAVRSYRPKAWPLAALSSMCLGLSNIWDSAIAIAVRHYFPNPGMSLSGIYLTGCALMAVAAFGFRRRQGLPRNLALALTPFIILIAWHFKSLNLTRNQTGDLAQDAATPARPIYILLFDGLSPDAVHDSDGKPHPWLPGFSALARDAVVFTEAYPPLCAGAEEARLATKLAMSGVLLGRPLSEAEVGFQSWTVSHCGERATPIDIRDSLLADARARGYRTALLGYFLPYVNHFEPVIDYGIVRPGFRRLADALFPYFIRVALLPNHTYHASIHDEAIRSVLAVAERWPRGSLTLLHDNIPHYPYPYDDEGEVRSRLDYALDWRLSLTPRPTAYARSVRVVDRDLKVILDRLKRAGTYDDSLIIVLSDHKAYASDRKGKMDELQASSRIPLIIKLPSGRYVGVVMDRVSSDRVRDGIRALMDNPTLPLKSLVKVLAIPGDNFWHPRTR